jgi:hypothetical protein
MGWPVLPCGSDKGPLIPDGKDAATRDEQQIRKWWARHPFALIGGRCDGLVVIDLDSYKDGHDKDFRSIPGDLPPTRTHKTMNGGTHLIYLDPDGICRSGKLGPTIDVRAGTSHDYIILPSPGGNYTVSDDQLPAPMPPWLPQVLGRSPGNADGPRALPDPMPLPRPLPPKVAKLFAKTDEEDRSGHTQALALLAAQHDFTDGQILTLLDKDIITSERRSEGKRQQPNWWTDEFWRVVDHAREHAQEMRAKGAAAVLMGLAHEHYKFRIADDGEPFALPNEGPLVVRMLRGDRYSLRAELSHRYDKIHGAPPANSAIADVLVALEGEAQLSDPVPLPLRVARYERELVLDLGDRTGRAVVIGPGGWKVVDRSPVLFRRTRLTAALPAPVRGAKLTDTLLPFLNVSRDDWPLMAACLVSMLWPDIPHPIPHLTGTEGVAKTATTRTLRSIMDPSSVATRGKPDEKDWDVALSAQWIVALDNLSSIPPWLSDALCRAVTGEGAVRRKLYTDADMAMISVRRVMIINGISTEIANADLAGRVITFELEPITAYKDETYLAEQWAKMHPLVLGALLDMAASVLQIAPDVELDPIYRMSDFARIIASLDQAHGTDALGAYKKRLESAALDVLHLDTIGTAILQFARTLKGQTWEGTIPQLEEKLRIVVGREVAKASGWPRTQVSWGTKIKRVGNPLQRAGVQIRKERRRNGMVYTIYMPESP